MTQARAMELIELSRYRNGGCLCVGAVRPNVASATREEEAEIRAVWRAMPGWTTQWDALWSIARGEIAGGAK